MRIIYLKNILLFVSINILSLGISANGQHQKTVTVNGRKNLCYKNFTYEKVRITFLQNKDSGDSTSSGITILFGLGFDKLFNFKVYLDDKFLQSISCETNYSIGYCTDSLKNVGQLYIPYNKIIKSSKIKIVFEQKFIVIDIPLNFKLYNRLKIFKSPSWNATFIKDYSYYNVE